MRSLSYNSKTIGRATLIHNKYTTESAPAIQSYTLPLDNKFSEIVSVT